MALPRIILPVIWGATVAKKRKNRTKHKCPLCGAGFRHRKLLLRHLWMLHLRAAAAPFDADILRRCWCGEWFKNFAGFWSHMEHENPTAHILASFLSDGP